VGLVFTEVMRRPEEAEFEDSEELLATTYLEGHL
jgi:hypothetical protein